MTGMTTLLTVMVLGTSICVPAVYASNVTYSGQEAPVAENTTVNPRAEITSMLNEARGKIRGQETRKYYDNLVAAYDLDEPSSGAGQAEYPDEQETLPDIEKIQNAALTLPLQEAGKRIKDKEIADFYYKFLKDAGWGIELGK